MKRYKALGKYIIRFLGSVCILTAMVWFVCEPIIKIDGIGNKEFRALRTKVQEAVAVEENWLLNAVARADSAEKEDLAENNLPHEKKEIQAWFQKFNDIAEETLNREISLKEVIVLIWNIPGIVEDAENLMETDLILDEGINRLVDYDSDTFGPRTLHRNMETAEEYFGQIRSFAYGAIAVTVLLGLLTGFAVIGNMCGKGRWSKYVLLLITLTLMASCYLCASVLPPLLRYGAAQVPLLKDLELRVTLIPILANILMISAVLLDLLPRKRQMEIRKRAVEETGDETTAKSIPLGKTAAHEAPKKTEAEHNPIAVRMKQAELRRKVLKELQDYVDKHRSEIKTQENIASNERFLSTTVRGGLIAAAAESACLERARKADGRAEELKRKITWHEQMLEKYR